MFIKPRIMVILAIAVVLVMISEWKYVEITTAIRATRDIREYHGLCNYGVGWPYAEFVHGLRELQESGDTNKLSQVLRRADDHSHVIFDVWLYGKSDAYKNSIEEILR